MGGDNEGKESGRADASNVSARYNDDSADLSQRGKDPGGAPSNNAPICDIRRTRRLK